MLSLNKKELNLLTEMIQEESKTNSVAEEAKRDETEVPDEKEPPEGT
jgi:hypothetical protein